MNNTTKTHDDYITVLRTVNPCNKKFSIGVNGIDKVANANIWDAHATTVHVPDQAALVRLLAEVSEDPCAALILGYIKGTTEYRLLSRKLINEARDAGADAPGVGAEIVNGITCYARLKENFSPSSWFVFDYDQPPGMPEQFKYSDIDLWVDAMVRLVPAIEGPGGSADVATMILYGSSSSRLLVDGKRQESAGFHCIMQAEDASDVERFGKMLFLTALQANMGFDTVTKGGAHRRCTIFDPTTFSRERLLFEGKPIAEGEGLSIEPMRPLVLGEGRRLDTSKVADVWVKIDGMGVERSSSGGYCTADHTSLTRDVGVDIKDHGVMTVGEYEEAGLGKVRCQSPFRDSDSMAAYLNTHDNGRVFLFDVGSQVKYILKDTPEEMFAMVPKKGKVPPPPPRKGKVPPPPPVAGNTALKVVAGTDMDKRNKEIEDNFEKLIRDLRVTAPGQERIERTQAALLIIEKLGVDEVATAVRWRQEVHAASELKSEDLKTLAKAVKATVKRQGKSSEYAPAHRLPVVGWPDMNSDDRPYCTIENTKYMLDKLGVALRYNRMTKDLDANIPWATLARHNRVNNAYAHLESISNTNGLSKDPVIRYGLTLADDQPFSPVAEWIESKPWDGMPRFRVLLDSMGCTNKELGAVLLKRWLISAVAAVYRFEGVAAQGVLVLQGEQRIGKTTWLKKLCGDETQFFKEGHHLDLKDKDSLLVALKHWIVELGELDSMFKSKRQIEELKAFITNSEDQLRRPYDRSASDWARSTVFCATVNPDQFLQDSTGDRRYWTLSVTRPDYKRMPDMQQLWAEVKTWFDAGERYDLTKEESEMLSVSNEEFTEVTSTEEQVTDLFDWDSKERPIRMSASQVMRIINPGAKISKSDAKDCRDALKKLTGKKPIRGNSGMVWNLPPLTMEV